MSGKCDIHVQSVLLAMCYNYVVRLVVKVIAIQRDNLPEDCINRDTCVVYDTCANVCYHIQCHHDHIQALPLDTQIRGDMLKIACIEFSHISLSVQTVILQTLAVEFPEDPAAWNIRAQHSILLHTASKKMVSISIVETVYRQSSL
jgi:hypothetical protein